VGSSPACISASGCGWQYGSEAGGLYRATFLYNPTMSASAVNLAALIARGEGMADLTEPEVPSRIQVPATTVTKDNVADVKELAY
jgi:ribose transport system substrate-binding protein